MSEIEVFLKSVYEMSDDEVAEHYLECVKALPPFDVGITPLLLAIEELSGKKY